MRGINRFTNLILLLLVSAALAFVAVSCSDFVNEPTNQQQSYQDQGLLTKDNPLLKDAVTAQERHTAELMSIPGVIGTAVGLTAEGSPCILVLTKTDLNAEALAKGTVNPIPPVLDKLPVEIMVTGEIKIFRGGYTTKQNPPIKLGTSGGWRYDLANGYCCGGTLGSLVNIGGTKYILSNYHVLESDIVSGGNSRTAQTGDYVIQPGLIDVNCSAGTAQNVGTLVKKSSLPNSNVDCAVAQVISGMVSNTGEILGIGNISVNTVAAGLNQAVKKSGRTTGLTRSSISGLNATISVSYENECAGGTAFTKTFTGQILIANRGSKFLNSGDSGSLLVEDVTTNPRAVGLLFAGGTSIAVANPIGQVLSFLNATMVGL